MYIINTNLLAAVILDFPAVARQTKIQFRQYGKPQPANRGLRFAVNVKLKLSIDAFPNVSFVFQTFSTLGQQFRSENLFQKPRR